MVSAAEWAQRAEASATSEAESEVRRAAARSIYGEPFETQAARIQKHSPYGRRPSWAVRPVIVKSGDDCRQELLAMQLIRAFHGIFQVRTSIGSRASGTSRAKGRSLCVFPLRHTGRVVQDLVKKLI